MQESGVGDQGAEEQGLGDEGIPEFRIMNANYASGRECLLTRRKGGGVGETLRAHAGPAQDVFAAAEKELLATLKNDRTKLECC